MSIKIATWNVNSINVRQDHVERWLTANNIDILMMQELKLPTESFPTERFEKLGYQCFVHGQKTYNGVAILSKTSLTLHETTLLDDDPQARFIHASLPEQDIHLINVYCPNGNPVETEKYPYKHKWMDALFRYTKNLLDQHDRVMIGGDFNIIPEEQDCYDPSAWVNDALFTHETRQIWQRFGHLGLYDAYRALYRDTPESYTFWDYQAGRWPKNQGIRIDHFLLSGLMADRLLDATIDKEPRGWEKPSDHTPFIISVD